MQTTTTLNAAKPVINFEPATHGGRQIIKIVFDYDKNLLIRVRKLEGVRWSQTMKCWYVPDTAHYRQKFKMPSRAAVGVFHQQPTYADVNVLVGSSERDPAISPTHAAVGVLHQQPALPTLHTNLCAENQEALRLFHQQLILKSYSPSTIRTYENELMQLLQKIGKVPAHKLTVADIKRYMAHCMEVDGIGENTAHSRLNALKFYYEQVLKKEKFFWEIPRPKKRIILPKVLGEDELGRLFKALDNKKHKAMLFTAYSAGLRVSEVAALKIKHIDSDRMQILVECGKGKKDRYVGLSPILLDILRDYIKTYKPRPVNYLFESETTKTAYPTRTIQQIFSNAKEKAGIIKDGGIHGLRHSFATHLLEKGIDVTYIKDLLGHFDIRTTERYLHVSKKNLVNIISPLDDLYKKGKVNW